MTFESALMLGRDDGFDIHLPDRLRAKSSLHFTPIEVARQAARLLAPHPGMSVLDVGAGAGKFCLAAADEVSGARFTGVEIRGDLVQTAVTLARSLALSNVEFVHADAFSLDWGRYDSFYFYNPFAEQLFGGNCEIDLTIPLEPLNFLIYLEATRQRLTGARVGTRVVTYHGLGGPLPASYERVRSDRSTFEWLHLWVKVSDLS